MAETKHYLYRTQPTRPAMLTEGLTAAERAIMTEHFSYLQRLTEQHVMSAKVFPYRIVLLSEANAHMPPDE